MYQLVLTNQFKKDIKRLQKRAYDMAIIKQAIIDLENNGQLQSTTSFIRKLYWILGSSLKK